MMDFNEVKIRFAITAAEGSLRRAAEALCVRRTEPMEFAVRTPDMLEFIQDVRDPYADDSQAILGDAIEAGSPWAIKYTLKTIGAKRGYGNEKAANKEPAAENRESELGNERSSQFPADYSPLAANDPLWPVQRALEETKGHVTRAATAQQTTRVRLKKLIAGSPALQMVLYQERESLADFAETALRQAVMAKKPWAIVFTLSTLCRDAGFGPQSKRARSSKSRLPNPEPSPVPETGAQRSRPGDLDSRVPNSAPAQTQTGKNHESEFKIGAGRVIRPEQPQPILVGAAAKQHNGTPALGKLSDVAAQLSGKMPPIAASTVKPARNARCPCASGRKFKRCCGA